SYQDVAPGPGETRSLRSLATARAPSCGPRQTSMDHRQPQLPRRRTRSGRDSVASLPRYRPRSFVWTKADLDGLQATAATKTSHPVRARLGRFAPSLPPALLRVDQGRPRWITGNRSYQDVAP